MAPTSPAARVWPRLNRALLALGAVALAVLAAAGLWQAGLEVTWPARLLNVALVLVEVILGAFALALLASLVPPGALPRRALPGTAEPVALLVPVANEEPDVLAATLRGVDRLTYPDVTAWVLDDTRDPARARELEDVARAHGARYVHRPEPRGYKAGAINHVLPRVEAAYVAVLDVDHVPAPDLVERLLERFVDERTAFVQGKIGWLNADTAFRRLAALLQHQFYEVVQREKEKRGTVVFAGSGAMFRLDALRDVGGFPEDTLVEDFDVTLSLTARGWRGRFADATVARGVLPWTAADQVRQLWRWSSGTTRILAIRWRWYARQRGAPVAVRSELLLDAAAYLAAGLIPLAGVLLLASAVARVPLTPAAGALTLLVPALLFTAHAGGAWVSAQRAGVRAGLVPAAYHIVSLAFTPVLFASTLWALLGGVGTHGRVSKVATGGSGAGTGTLLASGATFVLGVTLLVASVLLFGAGSGAWLWTGELGIAFLLPLAFLAHGGRAARVAAPPA